MQNVTLPKPAKHSKASCGTPPIILTYPPFTLAQAFSKIITHISLPFGNEKTGFDVFLSTGK